MSAPTLTPADMDALALLVSAPATKLELSERLSRVYWRMSRLQAAGCVERRGVKYAISASGYEALVKAGLHA